ncbi:hypothetical protein Syncc8109_0399 [Synechococcus sp. WH 8109]|nr:hypothetical protein Syncc8109_0399 [Synechococcus sp. WH 8109]
MRRGLCHPCCKLITDATRICAAFYWRPILKKAVPCCWDNGRIQGV